MNLTEELELQRLNSLKNAAPGMTGLIEGMLADLRAQQRGLTAPKPGELAPPFALPGIDGTLVSLAERLSRGPVILSFYRGGWCPYCNLELRAYQRALPRIRALGAGLIAVSPQTPDASLDTAQKNALAFDVLSDVGSRVAADYGLAFTMPDALKAVYEQRGIALPRFNGDEEWHLPIPATFVIAPGSRVVLSHVDVDYRQRLDPEAVIAALEPLAAAAT